ncbi:hypothetical protein GCM10025865_11400 [Paraoerskovia sediminicola]|uniref:F5/8 type C domain-containing protein n=1 Tax=Paraoerskovia sediminicola TaxID=1138587 RepID=A0ABN6XAM7_9CELL|nr:discoidin domain-containing protein [Paraoerskovia sediminicola]BDZ41841.1 hypothetical protein GCM10025865_11400 [Paraoerskovia sediminicola]
MLDEEYTMRRRSLIAGTTATALAVGLAAAAGTPAAAGGHQDTDPSEVQVFMTTRDRAELLQERDPIEFSTGRSDLTTITVDPKQTFQTMDGFGASITDSSASVLMDLPAAQRDETMRKLFDPEDGIGVSFLRQPIGSSDFTAEDEHYSLDDVPAGETDFGLEHFSIAHDEREILPLLREALELNPDITVLATPWSPPAWMKTEGSMVGGRLIDEPRYYDAYARYLVKFVEAYEAAGVPVDLLTVQNEPQNRTPDGYPGTDMGVDQQIKVIEALGPKLKKAKLDTRILGYDHNWATHPNDLENLPEGQDPEPDYVSDILDSDAARWVAGTAFHCYYGDPSAQTALKEKYPSKDIWFTECSGSHGPDDAPADVFRETLKWHARTIAVGTTTNWARSVVNWNIALREDGGPHLGGCDTCTGLVTVTDDGEVRTDAEYYTIGHLSKFVKPGAERVASTNFGETGWNGQLSNVAFHNPDGSTVLVVHNQNDDPRGMAIAVGDHVVEYEMPGSALATFVWDGLDAKKDSPTEVPIDGATATATNNPGDAGLAIDPLASSRWSSGAGQEPGQHLQIDLDRARAFDELHLDSGGNLGDYARSWKVETSVDGKHWRTFGSGEGTGQLTVVEGRTVAAKHIRISSTGSAGNWWSIADVRLYR